MEAFFRCYPFMKLIIMRHHCKIYDDFRTSSIIEINYPKQYENHINEYYFRTNQKRIFTRIYG